MHYIISLLTDCAHSDIIITAMELTHLNPEQLKAVTTPSQYVRIIAGAGSGKTRVLTSRIVYLIRAFDVRPQSILAITFTNKAANEMKQRLFKELGDIARMSTISTIHSLCVRMLREDIGVLNWPKNFTVMDEDDQKTLIKLIMKDLGFEKNRYKPSSLINYISSSKGGDISVERAKMMAGTNETFQDFAKVYERYLKVCESKYFLDFDDLLLKNVMMLKGFPSVRAKWQKRFHYIHVDEFQDVDHVQYEMLRLLKSSENYVYVVGDPDQTIYTWRGADVNFILNYERDFSPCESIVLNQNYRSTKAILDGANSLIKNNTMRVDKDLFTENESMIKIEHHSFNKEAEQADWVARKLKEFKQNGLNYANSAILYRSNYISREMEKACRNHHIPYMIYGGQRFFDRMEVKDMLAYARCVVVQDDLSFMRIINTPRRGISPKTVDALTTFAYERGLSYFEAASIYREFTPKVNKALDQFVQLIESLRRIQSFAVDVFFEQVFMKSGLKTMLEEENELDRIENVKELMNDAREFMITYPEASLDEYLQLVALYTDKNTMLHQDHVSLMSVHAAKGLEFEHVFLVEFCEGVFPNERSLSEGKHALEEERRLAYVAMTRAKIKLFITDSAGHSFVLARPKQPSRFIDEIDEACIHHVNKVVPKSNVTVMPSSNTVPIRLQDNFKMPYQIREEVVHTDFGEGIVTAIEGAIMTIAFKFPHGIKKMIPNPALRSKKEFQS
jgi:DNA helicase II / ATP-dependent DNA helicase PcrA